MPSSDGTPPVRLFVGVFSLGVLQETARCLGHPPQLVRPDPGFYKRVLTFLLSEEGTDVEQEKWLLIATQLAVGVTAPNRVYGNAVR